LFLDSAGNFIESAVDGVLAVAGTPEGLVAASPGRLLVYDTSGNALYAKFSGTGTTGWKTITHA
jgi:hypothetical protein